MSNRYKLLTHFALFLTIFIFVSFSGRTLKALNIGDPLKHPGFNPSRTSIAVVDVQNGKSLADHQPDLSLNPASCAKIITSAAALALLGVDHRFATEFSTDRQYSGGTIGTLFVSGTGNPMLINEEVAEIANELHRKGLRRITNGITINNSYFDSYEFPRKGGNDGRAYTAKTAATAVNFNSIAVQISPGKKAGAPAVIETNPPTNYFRIVNKVVTGGKYRANAVIKQDGDHETITVTGRIPAKSGTQEFYRSVTNPALYAGAIVKYMLEQNRIVVEGPLKEGVRPANATLIFNAKSKPLSEIVREMNKRSNNFIAEQLIKHLGAIKYGVPGSTQKGAMVVSDYLASIGIPKGTYTLENGSGLSDNSHISAKQLVQVLVAAYKNRSIRDGFMSSFSILGVDGTTKKWHFAPDLSGKILVKTGTLNGVSSLAGYAPTANGSIAAFAILANNIPRGAWTAHEAELKVVRAITEASE